MSLAKSKSSRSRIQNRKLTFQPLEPRLALAASVGWDGPGLGSAQLTYNIANNPTSLSKADVTSAIEKALSVWSSVANIKFTPTNQKGLSNSLDISFTRIDGPGRTLAQAYFPKDVNPAKIAGDVQFDSSETWEIGNSKGSRAFDLVWVAVHEIGHSLGLDHINVAGAVLAPSVSPTQQFVKLSTADVSAVQRLYAKAARAVSAFASDSSAVITNNSTTTTSSTNPSDNGDSDENPFPQSRWRRGGNWQPFGDRLDSDTPQDHNLYDPTDVNGDSITSPIDVLQVINFLNRSSNGGSEGESTGLCDTNGDGEVSPIDVLTVINALSRASSSTSQSQTNATSSSDSQVPGTEMNDDSDTDPNAEDCDHGTSESSRHRSVPGFSLLGLGRQTPTQIIDRFDDNADEILVEDEVPVRLWKKLIDQGVDANEDSSITLEELETAVTTARTKVFNAKDTDANGFLTESEVNSRFWAKLSTADTNSDSNISLDEFSAWLDESTSTDPSLNHKHHSHHVDRIFASFRRASH